MLPAPTRVRGVCIDPSSSTVPDVTDSVRKILAQARSEVPHDPLRIAVAQQDLNDAQRCLEKGMNVDRTLAVVVPSAELVIGFVPVYVGELLAVGALGAATSWAGGRARRAHDKIARVSQKFRVKVVSIVLDAGRDPAEVEELFPGRPVPLPGAPTSRSLTVGNSAPAEDRAEPGTASSSPDRQDARRRLAALSREHDDDAEPGSGQQPA
jgi:hypothetical protein